MTRNIHLCNHCTFTLITILDRKDCLHLDLALCETILEGSIQVRASAGKEWHTKWVFKESLKRELFTKVWTGLWKQESETPRGYQ